MDRNFTPEVDVELVGFSARDRILFTSLFRVSSMRPLAYREWQLEKTSLPLCVLLDVDEDSTNIRRDLEALRPGRYPIIAIGKEAPKKLAVAAHLKRPIRWSEILHTLDITLGGQSLAEAAGGNKPEKLLEAENELEIGQIDSWYARGTAKTFESDPAILVIDPDPAGADFIKSKLAGSGYSVDSVATGAKSLGLIAKNRYNCVIMETQLPDISGLEICELLKSRPDRRRTATIFLTTSTNPLDRVRGISAGCDAFLNKPIKQDVLLSTLEKFLPEWKMKVEGNS